MPEYRVRFADHGGNVYATEHVDHDNDEVAIEHIRRRSSRGMWAGYDTWGRRRLVHRDQPSWTCWSKILRRAAALSA